MKTPYVVKTQSGAFVASAITITGIRSRLLWCKAGEIYMVSGGMLRGTISGKKTPLRKLLRTIHRYAIAVPFLRWEETVDSMIGRFGNKQYADVLTLLARVLHYMGAKVVRLEPNVLVVKKKSGRLCGAERPSAD